MHTSTNLLRRLLPTLLLASLALASCGEDCKDDDPKPAKKHQDRCPSTPPPPAPGGNS